MREPRDKTGAPSAFPVLLVNGVVERIRKLIY